VPALDAVLFLTPRNSQVDVVQSVGRVMRQTPDRKKKRGYVILPVVIPANVEPHKALDDNKIYAVVWEVLQALRSHDDRFDAMVNKLEFIGKDPAKMEVIAITDKVQKKAGKTGKTTNRQAGKGKHTIGANAEPADKDKQLDLAFEIGEIERAIYAKVVQKCGNRHHWEDWANDIAKIANTHISRITAIIENPDTTKARATFHSFAEELRRNLNGSLTDAEIIEMLAQHLVTKPVFDALFSGYNFTEHNPMSLAMQNVLNVLHEHHLEKEADTLQGFYDSVALRAKDINNAQGKQKIVVELYDKFFRNAFSKMTERLGIVYTPVEVVDFIIHSINDLLQSEFGLGLGSDNVHILDPFTGTGTFITRLLQSGLISKEQLPHKYRHEIHANELVLLAYYIAAINIEATYHGLAGGDYEPFAGVCLTDTFQLSEEEDLIGKLLEDNSSRRKKQKALDIRVIMGNPPYSIGQGSENDNNQNVVYPHLDSRIRDTYAARSNANLQKGLYDSYIRAIRWASDRIGNSGIIGFVTNAGFVATNTADGLRQCLAEEFSSLYVFHLRGLRGKKTSGERAKQEGGQIFGMGSGAAIAITLFVKNPLSTEHGRIFFHDIGAYLSREDKLKIIADFKSLNGITAADGWQPITPDAHGDWLNQRDDRFSEFIVLGDKKGDVPKLFDNFSLGVVTSRDAWCYNASKTAVAQNMGRMIEFYNHEVARYRLACAGLGKAEYPEVNGFINTAPRQISWSRALKQELAKSRAFSFESTCLTPSLYRPFSKQWMYFNRRFNEMVYQMPRIFPNAEAENLVMCFPGLGERKGFAVLMTKYIPDFNCFDGGAQCFPLYLYDSANDEAATPQTSMFAALNAPGKRRDAITDAGLKHFQDAYPGEKISKQDLFYYIYGLLHSPDYRSRYTNNLNKELPRIPRYGNDSCDKQPHRKSKQLKTQYFP